MSGRIHTVPRHWVCSFLLDPVCHLLGLHSTQQCLPCAFDAWDKTVDRSEAWMVSSLTEVWRMRSAWLLSARCRHQPVIQIVALPGLGHLKLDVFEPSRTNVRGTCSIPATMLQCSAQRDSAAWHLKHLGPMACASKTTDTAQHLTTGPSELRLAVLTCALEWAK